MAQTQGPTLFVLSAWAHTCTMSTHVKPPGHGMDAMQQWPKESETMYTCKRTTPSSVWNGSRHKAVPATSTTASRFALDAVLPHMELMPVLECRRLKALTPYHLDAWEARLREAGLRQKYPHIVSGLRLGFIIDFPHVIITQIPPNKDSIKEFAEEFSRIVHNEIQKGRYIGLIS